MPKINYNIPATSYCHGGTRALSAIKYIVLHYTAVNGDTAKNEATYFSRNYSRYAGAHFFVDQSGYIAQSIEMNVTAWSVGGSKYSGTSPQYYGACTNFNSVSIEMCDQVNKDASAKQIEAVRWLVGYIQSKCSNAKTIIRHYDVNGKPCPARYLNASKWSSLKAAVSGGVGWQKIGGTWYYYKSNGTMATGWLKDKGKWYYLKSDGAMATGWVKVKGVWYYLTSSGAMATGWIKDKGKWYYLESSGAMAIGWKKVNGKWYYLTSSGAMATGWLKDKNKWYYLSSSGAMVTGTVTIDGKKYTFNSSGALIE